jgi:hypothetical protein
MYVVAVGVSGLGVGMPGVSVGLETGRLEAAGAIKPQPLASSMINMLEILNQKEFVCII